jgi:lipid A 3-O-deacylase
MKPQICSIPALRGFAPLCLLAFTVTVHVLSTATVAAQQADQTDIATPSVPEDNTEIPVKDEFRLVGVQLIHDNDGWITNPFSKDDKHYTAGSRVDLFLQGGPVNSVGNWLPFNDNFDAPQFAGGVGVSQLIFTSKDVEEEDPPIDERPYAGALRFHTYIQRFDDTTLDHIEIDLGVVGPSSLAEETQTALHTARGWDTQLKDEFVADLTLRKGWKYGLFGTQTGREGAEGWGAELLPQIGGTLGTAFRQAHAQITVRAGYNIPGDFGPRRVFDTGSAAPDPLGRRGGYIFARGHLRGVEHNIFLDGNNYRSSRSVDKENVVGEFEAGIAAQLGRNIQVGWSVTALSDEYETDNESDSYASVYFTAHFNF